MEITDEMCRRAVHAFRADRIQGFSTFNDDRHEWGPPHYVLDVFKDREQQEIWRGDSHSEMTERCALEKMRIVLVAALGAPTP